MSTSAHVTESGLSRSVGTRSTNSGDSGNGSTGSPRLCCGLMTSDGLDSLSLSSVLSDVVVNEMNDIVSDRSSEDCGEGYGGDDLGRVVVIVD